MVIFTKLKRGKVDQSGCCELLGGKAMDGGVVRERERENVKCNMCRYFVWEFAGEEYRYMRIFGNEMGDWVVVGGSYSNFLLGIRAGCVQYMGRLRFYDESNEDNASCIDSDSSSSLLPRDRREETKSKKNRVASSPFLFGTVLQ